MMAKATPNGFQLPDQPGPCPVCRGLIDFSDCAALDDIQCPHCQAEIIAPTRLGHLEFLARAGLGGSGQVYQARRNPDGAVVAVKILHTDRDQFQSLQREARLAAALHHDHIVKVIAYEEIQGMGCLIMEWMSGGSLEDRLRDRARLPEEDVLRLAGQCLQALEACYRIQLVHGDIKPGNILFDEKDRAKIADFGIAHLNTLTRDWRRDIRGTVFYSAPEKARGKNENHKSDVYCLAAVLWHALVGRPPFEGTDMQDRVDLRLNLPPPSAREVNPAITRLTDALLVKMMNPDPAERLASFPNLKTELHRARTELSRIQRQPGKGSPTVVHLPGSDRSNLGARMRDTMRNTATFFRRNTIRLKDDKK